MSVKLKLIVSKIIYIFIGTSFFLTIFNVLYVVSLRAPKWYKRTVGASFGFGGKVVSFRPQISALGTSASSEVIMSARFILFCFI